MMNRSPRSGGANEAAVRAEADVRLKELDADIAVYRALQAIVVAEMAFPIMRWIRPGFAYLSMYHYGMVILASTGLIHITVKALPTPMDYLEIVIIGSYFLFRPKEKAARTSLVGEVAKGR
jgi:hypothetical protein